MDYDKMITIVRNIKDLSVEAEKMFYLSGWKLGSSRIGRNHAFI